jgi:predicted Holliday junction resolvase-like endonuclease
VASNTMIWIIVAIVVAIGVVAVLAFMARNRRRHAQAEHIREDVGREAQRVEKREAFADETEAKARAARAEAEAKAAEAARLEGTAASHRDAVNTSRQELDGRRERADALDPKRGNVQGPKDGVQEGTEAHPRQTDTPTTQRRHRL